jgi:hypothetical protein
LAGTEGEHADHPFITGAFSRSTDSLPLRGDESAAEKSVDIRCRENLHACVKRHGRENRVIAAR